MVEIDGRQYADIMFNRTGRIEGAAHPYLEKEPAISSVPCPFDEECDPEIEKGG